MSTTTSESGPRWPSGLLAKSLLGIGVLLLVLVAVAYVLPRQVRVERTTDIDVPQDEVFAVVNSFAEFSKWSPWAQLDPNAKYTFAGSDEGVGAMMVWEGDPATIGSGSQEIIASDEPTRVQTRIKFGGQNPATATLALSESAAGGTHVSWVFETDLGMNPVGRYFGLSFDTMIGGDFERGLANLKTYLESRPKATPLVEAPAAVQEPEPEPEPEAVRPGKPDPSNRAIY